MTGLALKVSGLGKHYSLNAGGGIKQLLPFGGRKSEEFWALKNVSFDVLKGEVVGLIGSNGAGKSTLFKLLSRITPPSTGSAEVHGRLRALIEVGTGFHPELTGRENVFLSGALMGMRRAEIHARFDEIVAFSEVGQFIDIPVKRYSSGMYMRLAFSVAAHLEPEILLVDEVLSVGDSSFQQKCLGKIGEVTRQGRTVLFVSHNMHAVQTLCTRALHIKGGELVNDGPAREVVSNYLSQATNFSREVTWSMDEAPGNQEVRLLRMAVASSAGEGQFIPTNHPIVVRMDFHASTTNPALCVGFDLLTADGVVVLRSYQTDAAADDWPTVQPGLNSWECAIPPGLLNGGAYAIRPRISMHRMYWIVESDPVITFDTFFDHGKSPLWKAQYSTQRQGVIAPILSWKPV